MDNICRICAEHKNNMTLLLKNVLSDELADEGQKYEKLFDIKVLDIPNHISICIICKNKLEDLFSFKEQAINSNSFLKNIYETRREEENDDHKLYTKQPLSIQLLDNSDIKDDNDSVYDNDDDNDDYNKFEDDFNSEGHNIEIFNIEKIEYYNENDEKEDENVVSKSPTQIELEHLEKKYKCILCYKRFRNELKFTNHMKAHMNAPRHRKPTTQKKVNKNVEQNSKPKKTRKRKNTKWKIRECSICSKKFGTEINLNAHMNTHKGLPPFSCDVCGKAFNHLTNFKYHMKSHNGVREFVCDICTKGFITNADLVIHKRSHTNERPFVCEICGQAFKMLGHLVYHKDCHNEDKKFKCEECNKHYMARKTLRAHIKDYHLEKQFNCEICDKGFSRRQYFKTHVKRHHEELIDKLFPDEAEKLSKLSTKAKL